MAMSLSSDFQVRISVPILEKEGGAYVSRTVKVSC